jgi:outer membrane receptor protein involved in Fe transport
MKRDFLTGARGAGYAAVGAALVAALPAPSQAQDGLLDEITVTASKREESVLDAPMTVDAIPSKDMISCRAST